MSEAKEGSDRPPEGDFQQQNLKAWQPLLTPFWVIVTFFFIGVVFLPIGIGIIAATDRVQEVHVQYNNLPVNQTTNMTTVQAVIPEDMQPPIYFYYKLTNFYQNHRRYVKSRFDNQLRGEIVTDDEIAAKCDPLSEWNGKSLYPCGLIANSYFTDTFNNPTIDGKQVLWDDSKIAWASDVEAKFKPFKKWDNNTMTNVGPQGVPLNHLAPDFIVWMRTAGLPTFKKLRYIINQTLTKGQTFRLDVHDVFDTSPFNGDKFVVLSTTSWLGGKNYFLGYAYVVVGGLCLLFALAFLVKHKVSPRDLGSIQYFNWHTSRGADASHR